MPYIGNTSPSRFVSNRAASVYSGDGSTTAFTLQQAVVQDEDILVSVDGVIQEPSVAYAVSNATTLTFTAAPSSNSGNNIFVYYLASQVGTVGHPSNQALTATNGTLTGTLGVTGALSAKGGAVFNEDSADVDFRVESNGNANMLFVDGGNDAVGIGNNNPADYGSLAVDLVIGTTSGENGMTIVSGTGNGGRIQFADNTSSPFRGAFEYDHSSDTMVFYTAGSARMRVDSAGVLMFGTTDDDPVFNNAVGSSIGSNNGSALAGVGQFSCSGGVAGRFNRSNEDGAIVGMHSQGTEEGTISTSGNTVSYNAFSGSHWSRLSDNSKPTILKGTVIETIDEMCDWYQAEFTVDGSTVKSSITLPSGKKVGDTITHTYRGTDYDAKIIKEKDNKHTKCKISDTADSKRVYGVFAAWDNDDDTVNDMYVTAVGTHVVRISKDITVSAGDLLSSNGDGTAKVQDDDIIRSKTIGKVLTNIKQETYSDGSYIVPCALYCG